MSELNWIGLNIILLEEGFGNDEGDVVKVLNEDDKYYYYEDGFDRYCYIEKTKATRYVDNHNEAAYRDAMYLIAGEDEQARLIGT